MTIETGHVPVTVLMNVDDQIGEWSAPASCRDKGWGEVDEGAWCLSWLGYVMWRGILTESWCDQDRHQAPSSTPRLPLPLQDEGPQTVLSFPHVVIKVHNHPCCMPSKEDINGKKLAHQLTYRCPDFYTSCILSTGLADTGSKHSHLYRISKHLEYIRNKCHKCHIRNKCHIHHKPDTAFATSGTSKTLDASNT